MPIEKQKALFNYLKDAQKTGRTFDVPTIAKVTGWKENSTKTTLRSRHYSSVVKQVDKGTYISIIDLDISLIDFVAAISQSSKSVLTKINEKAQNPLVEHLAREAKDAFVLAVELFNRPSIVNKHGPFAVVMGMAWEKLLKARLIVLEDEGAVFLADGKAIGFEKCIHKVFQDPNDNVRKNLLELKEMRDGAIHFLVPEIGNLTTPFFQAAVLNFRRCYEEWMQEVLFQVPGSGLMSLILANDPIKSVHLKSLYGEQLASAISTYATALNEKVGSSTSETYCVSIEVTLKNVKKVEEADLKVWSGQHSDSVKVIPVETPVDATKTYTFKPTALLQRINGMLREMGMEKQQLTMHSLNAIIYKAKFRSDQKYHRYDSMGNYHAYSQAALDKIIDLIKHGQDYVRTALLAYNKRPKNR